MLENDVAPENLRVTLHDAGEQELVAYQPAKPKGTPMPKPVEKPKSPKDYTTTDELYFTGQRIEQLYSPSFEAAPYYEEILRRDLGDYRANTALGILFCKQWRWEEAAKHLSNAIARATANHIRPKDGEACYYLGVALRAQGKLAAAYESYQKAVWSTAWQAAGGCELAEIDLQRRDYAQALVNTDLALAAAGRNPKARNLKATILRKLGRPEEAEQIAVATLAIDPLNVRSASEQILAQRQRGAPEWRENVARLRQLMGRNPEAFLENTFDFANSGQWSEVAEILREQVMSAESGQAAIVASEPYLLASALERRGRTDEAAQQFAAAARSSPAFCFPSRFEEEPMLRRAMEANPKDANAPYLLGCLLYDNQPENAIKAWEESRRRDDKLALTHRNLALAYAQHEKNVLKAIASLEKAVELNPNESRFFYELDVQYEAAGAPVAKRLELLAKHREIVEQRDDATTRLIVLLTAADHHDEALRLLRERHFHNWEGSRELHDVYVNACLRRGVSRFRARQFAEALQDFEAAFEYPLNQEVGRPRFEPRAAQIHYLIGLAQEALGAKDKSAAAYQTASSARAGGPSEAQYFKALTLQKVGKPDEARRSFEGLVKQGLADAEKALETPDYFAKFGEKRAERVRLAQAHYLAGLGYLGLGQAGEARSEFAKTLELHPSHLGALSWKEPITGPDLKP
jgi:tetratricopeptide (TPR) repeat protein